ncbi:MAG: peptidase dimerization domain-containing protein [Caldilineaceae bacterium]
MEPAAAQPRGHPGGADLGQRGKFRLVVRGRGGHGAVPHETIDATVVAAQILVNWQTIVSRNVSPLEAAVVTVGSLRSGEAYNIISAEAELLGTYRAFSEEMRTMVLTRLEEMAQHISAATARPAPSSTSATCPRPSTRPRVRP